MLKLYRLAETLTTDVLEIIMKEIIMKAVQLEDSQWELFWSDEFDGTELDSSKWVRCSRGTSDWNDTMLENDPRLVTIKDGIVHLRGIVNDQPEPDQPDYLTGGITSKELFTFEYGKVQIRARIQSAAGAWPALWMLGAEQSWPANGEIDLMEHLNFEDKIYQTVHSEYTLSPDYNDEPPKSTTVPIDRDNWNTYGCEWEPDKIVFTVNGNATHIYPRVPELGEKQWPFNHPFYFILSMQIGGSWVNSQCETNPDDYPAGIEVDWIRVYKQAAKVN